MYNKSWKGASQSWGAWSPQMPKPGKGRKTDKTERKEDTVPGAYDSAPWDSSWSAPTDSSTDDQAKAFMDAFLKFTKETDQPVPAVLQGFFKQDVKGELKDQQKKLNQHRAVLQKIDNKKKAIRRDEEQWQKWIQDIRELIKKQRARHEEQSKKLQEELVALEKKEEDLRTGKEESTETINVEEDEEDLDAMLDACATPVQNQVQALVPDNEAIVNAKIQAMKSQLEAEYQQKLEESCNQAHQVMQHQPQHHLAVRVAHMTGQGFEQSLITEQEESEKNPGAREIGPFTRRGYREAQSPYARNNGETMQERMNKTHGNSPHGVG